MARFFILAGLLLSGCASVPGLYTEIGIGYKLAETTSYVLRQDCHQVQARDRGLRSCGGDNPTAQFNVGYQFTDRYRCEFSHWSHFFDGGPDRETHKDEIRCFRRFGGK